MQHIFRKGPLKGWLVNIRWLFEPRDIWVGVYWKRYPAALDLFVCLLPLVPINVYVQYMLGGMPSETVTEQHGQD